jgi:hypothetical protein
VKISGHPQADRSRNLVDEGLRNSWRLQLDIRSAPRGQAGYQYPCQHYAHQFIQFGVSGNVSSNDPYYQSVCGRQSSTITLPKFLLLTVVGRARQINRIIALATLPFERLFLQQ